MYTLYQNSNDNFAMDLDSTGNNYVLVKGEEESMVKKLKLNFVEQQNLDAILRYYYHCGYKPVIYAKKKLSHDDAIEY